jgi:TPR repeat protein
VLAARYYKLAAEQGNALGRSNLAAFYRDGRGGLPKDDAEAARLYQLAAGQSVPAALANLGKFIRMDAAGSPGTM